MKAQRVYKEFADGAYKEYYLEKMVGGGVVVDAIEYHEPQGEGDAHYCDILFSDGTVERLFRPNSINFSK